MLRHIFLLAVAACFIQTINCDAIDDLVNELKPVIDKATEKVRNVTTKGKAAVATAHNDIQSNINYFEEVQWGERGKLLKTMLEYLIQAIESHKNIYPCIKQVIDSAKDMIGIQFELCRFSPELHSLDVELNSLSQQEVILSSVSDKCINQSRENLVQVKICILDSVNAAEEQADKIDVKIESTVRNAELVASHCAGDRGTELGERINTVTNDFKDCARSK